MRNPIAFIFWLPIHMLIGLAVLLLGLAGWAVLLLAAFKLFS